MPAEAALPSFADLQRELSPISPRAWRFAALRACSRAGSLLSDGLRIGYRHGFDSGPFMAHVYANRPSGRTPLGRAIDRRLLRRRTCVAFRDIRAIAERAVLDALRAERARAPVVADLAAGPAPYLLTALSRHPRARAIVADADPDALEQARRGADALGLGERVTFVRADAFDRDALQALRPAPDVIVELGLYGIYHDDALIERHLDDLAQTAAPRQIVFNVQTQNPEIEYIARVWRDHRGERCVWRLRPLELLLGWARSAGYMPASVRTDRQGIYRVVRLEREAPEEAA
jgi:precorrin-6B methylase 2